LYIGKTEHELIETISHALRDNPDLKVSILTDALRGTRETPNPSCASLLCSLVSEYGSERVEIRMFHTPNLTGLKKKWIPKRINEGWGLQHMKLYGVDDEIIISGYVPLKYAWGPWRLTTGTAQIFPKTTLRIDWTDIMSSTPRRWQIIMRVFIMRSAA
jgi:phosphatidylserine/phosphatidylglycerophosphate/cardiolipin synthase-like enzyme